MPASLRMEIFPSDFQRCIDFYTQVLRFEIRKSKEPYVYMNRDNIFIGAIAVPSDETLEEKQSYRRPQKGVEIVMEVDDLDQEMDYIVSKGWKLEYEMKMEEWGLRDFSIIDPDGYLIRFTTHSLKRDGTGL